MVKRKAFHTERQRQPLAEHQSTIPAERNTARKLGIRPKESVLFFAGYYGDWAKALSRHATVLYSDSSSTSRNFARTQNPGRIKTFLVGKAENAPRKPNAFDWSVSYEPASLVAPGNLTIAMTRALLNRKGGKIIIGTGLPNQKRKEIMYRITQHAGQIYGAKTRVEVKDMLVKTAQNERSAARPITVITLITNLGARKKADLDLRVMPLAEAGRAAKEIAFLLGTSEQAIKQSQRRIGRLKNYIDLLKEDWQDA